MGILSRFKDIMERNKNAFLDKAGDPDKMAAEYVRNLKKDLGKMKSETASAVAEEQRIKRQLEEYREEMEKLERYAVKASEEGDEGAARRFSDRKASLTAAYSEMQAAYQLAASNSQKMKQIQDQLTAELSEWEAEGY